MSLNAAIKIKNSPTKPLVPGKPNAANVKQYLGLRFKSIGQAYNLIDANGEWKSNRHVLDLQRAWNIKTSQIALNFNNAEVQRLNTQNYNTQLDELTIYGWLHLSPSTIGKEDSSSDIWIDCKNTSVLPTTTIGNSSIDKFRIPGLSFEIAPSAVTQGGVFYENNTTLSADYTITDGRNAMAAGPITINNGITLTIGSGESVTIV